MAIWSSEIKELEKLYESIKGQLPDLEKELTQLIHSEDANVILLYSRRCLEVIISDLCECELKRPRKTEPLKGIIDKLQKEDKVPAHIITSMHGLNELSTYGAHPKDFDPEQVKPVLNNLDIIIKWYLRYKGIGTEIKTKPTKEIRQEIKGTGELKKDITISRKRLAGLLLGLVALVAVVFAVLFFSKIVGGGKQTKELEKSIAVLPFINDSPDQGNGYFINGLMDEVLNNLQVIKEFRVLSRTSTMQFTGTERPTVPEIAKKLNVNYIVEGSGQKYVDKFVLRVQLIAANNEKHLWGKTYTQDIKEAKDIFEIQSQVAEAIASSLKAIITPEEKQIIENTPTLNLTAYDFYQMGKEEVDKSEYPNFNVEAGKRAETLFHKALEYDSTFALAYQALAEIFWKRRQELYPDKDEIFLTAYLDSMLIYADIALSYDDQLSVPYIIRGAYNGYKGSIKKAIEEYDRAIILNPNDYRGYFAKGGLYEELDLSKAIENLQKASSLYYGPGKPDGLRRIGDNYSFAGLHEKAKDFYTEALKLDGDSAAYNLSLVGILVETRRDFKTALDYFKKRYLIDSTDVRVLDALGYFYLLVGDKKESLKYYEKYVSALKAMGNNIPGDMYLGLAYLQNGYKDKARYYFEQQIKVCSIQLNSVNPGERVYWSYPLAAIYAIRGEKAKAYEYLKIFDQNPIFGYHWVVRIKDEPFFITIKNEPEFQQIAKDVETKYQAEHERVRKWLEEQGML